MKTKIVKTEAKNEHTDLRFIKRIEEPQIMIATNALHYPVFIGSYKARRISEWLLAAADEIDKSVKSVSKKSKK